MQTKIPYFQKVKNSQICAYFQVRGSNACQGEYSMLRATKMLCQFRKSLQLSMGGCMERKADRRISCENLYSTQEPAQQLPKSPTMPIRQQKQSKDQFDVSSSPMTTGQLDNPRESTSVVQDEEIYESGSEREGKTCRQPLGQLRLPNPEVSSYNRSQTNNSNLRNVHKHEDSRDYIDSRKHKCLVKRPSYLQNSARMEQMQNNSSTSHLMCSNMRLGFTGSSMNTFKPMARNKAI